MYINRDINEARITRTARINYFSFRVNPCNPCLIYISLRDFSVLFEVLVDGIYLFNDECHLVFQLVDLAFHLFEQAAAAFGRDA